MASKKPAVEQPAEKPAAKSEKPAAGVGIAELAHDLGRDPKAVRAAIRRLRGGAQVGQGGRYEWSSKTDPDYKQLLTELSAKKGKETVETAS
jgi:hypothetical protein